MTTVPLSAPRPALLAVAAAWLAAWFRRSRARVAVALQLAVRLALTVAGLGLVTAGVWHGAGMTWGLVCSGVSALLLEWAVKR